MKDTGKNASQSRMQKFEVFFVIKCICSIKYWESPEEVAHSVNQFSKQDLLSICDNSSSILKCTDLQNNSLLFYVCIKRGNLCQLTYDVPSVVRGIPIS